MSSISSNEYEKSNLIDYSSITSIPVLMPYTNNIPIYPIFYDNKYGKLSDTAFMNFEPLFFDIVNKQ
jgi:hypothetical protein